MWGCCPMFAWSRECVFDTMLLDAQKLDDATKRYREEWARLLPTPKSTGFEPLPPADVIFDMPSISAPIPSCIVTSQDEWGAYLNNIVQQGRSERQAFAASRQHILERCPHAGALARELYSWRSVRLSERSSEALELTVLDLADAVSAANVDFEQHNLVIIHDTEPSPSVDVYAYHFNDDDEVVESYVCPAPIGCGVFEAAHHCFAFKIGKSFRGVRVFKLTDVRPHTVDDVLRVIDNDFGDAKPELRRTQVATLQCATDRIVTEPVSEPVCGQ